MLGAVLILAAFYLPGHFLGGRLARKGDGSAELAMMRVAISLALAAPVLTALALSGFFSVPVILAVFGGCALLAFAFRGGREASVRATRWDFGALALVAASFALYSRPAEYVINSRDPGVYALFADRLARTGALLHRDPLVGMVAPFHSFLQGKKYPGFFVYGEDLIVPQFFPGPFALLGFGNLVGGVWGSLFVVPVMGALAVGMAFLVGKELFGRCAGFVGAALLAPSYVQVWWSRHPSSEVMAQLFALAGLWFAVRFARKTDPFCGILAGVLLGGAMLLRVDAFLAALALPLLFAYDLLTRRPALRWLYPGVPLALFAGGALLYLNTIGGRYLYILYSEHGLDGTLALAPFGLASAAILAGAFVYVRRRWGEHIGHHLEARGGRAAVFAACCVAVAALWAYFVMPVPWESLPEDLRDFNAYRSQVLVRMVWFTTPVVAVLGLAGLILAAHRPDRPRAIFLAAVLGFGILYTAMPNVAPDLPWATRRFVPAVFPGVCLLAGHAAVEAGRGVGRFWDHRAGMALAGVLLLAAFGCTAHVSAPIVPLQELDGAVRAFGRVEKKIPEAEVVYMEMPAGHDMTASTFEYLYGHPVLPYDRIRFIREVDELEKAGLLEKAVYVTTRGEPAPLVSGVHFREVAGADIKLPRLAPVEGHEGELRTQTDTLHKVYRVFVVEAEG